MKDIMHTAQVTFAALGGLLGLLLGGLDGMLYALVGFVTTDYITGVIVAVIEKKLSSEIGFRGIAKKVMIFVLVGIANAVDVYLVQSGSMARTAVIFYYLSNEGISILENAAKVGLPVPDKLRNILAQLGRDDTDENAEG